MNLLTTFLPLNSGSSVYIFPLESILIPSSCSFILDVSDEPEFNGKKVGLHHPNYYMEQSYFGGPAFVYRFSKDCASRKKTVLWDFVPSQVSIPFLTLLEKSVDTSPLLLICPYRVSGKIYIYLYRTHQYISRFLLRPMFHLHCPFTLYSP